MATASKHSLFLAALKARLETIFSGDSYWYRPRVVRIPGFKETYLDASLETIYFLVPGNESPMPMTFGRMKSELRLDLLLARRFEGGDDPFSPPDPDRWEEQDRIRQDATKVLEADFKVGGTSIETHITRVEMAAEDVFHETWAVVFMSLLATFEYAEGAP